ncbi:MAG: alpha/beta hydrolase fold domain-containing protein, partial [Acidobacteria bacterium]|nr:alpha/beta hydrolase fold domain-containing protein [Acidobacteriota bacterium]
RLSVFGLAALAALAQNADRPGRLRTTVERLETVHLEAVHKARRQFAASRRVVPRHSLYLDFRAVLHVHAEDAPHTKGTRPELLAAAKETGVRVVIFTDHRGPKPETWRGMREGVLFLAGSEDDHQLRVPGDPELKFLSHLESRPDMPAAGFNGTEIYNRHTDAADDPDFIDYFKAAAGNPAEWASLVKRWRQYPDEAFNAGTDYLPVFVRRWDKETAAHAFTGVAANDSHQNQIFQGVVFDPYAVSLRSVSTHILARELSDAAVRAALVAGHAYVAHDWLADPTGFSLLAVNNLGAFDMGDPVPLTGTAHLRAELPLPAHLRVFRDGAMVSETTADRLDLAVKEPGAYRLEAWLPVDGEERIWIYSNPIYFQRPEPGSIRLPSSEIAPDVALERDIAYIDDALPKHKLDVYTPKGAKGAPVMIFLHGGAWRSGDRGLYTALGNRYAHEGIVTVIPSYRLAPADPHPAQVEDAAAAVAWAMKNLAKYGGDPKRVFLAGHSAGGHLAALLALDPKWLGKHGLTPSAFRGVIPMSGVYQIEGLERVFGTDAEVKRQASPLTHVHAGAPSFLITYCQWDYPFLPAQAEQFQAALEKAGTSARVVYIPGLNHITEMLNIAAKDDPTVKAVLEFIRR